MTNLIDEKNHQFAFLTGKLNALSPLAVISRGYTITQKEDRSSVLSTKDIVTGDTMYTIVSDGTIQSIVNKIEKKA